MKKTEESNMTSRCLASAPDCVGIPFIERVCHEAVAG